MVKFGTEENNCSSKILQFDIGRGTTQRLSEVGIQAPPVQAIFVTHIHSDHVDGLADLMHVRWHFASQGPKVDLVCSEDAASPAGHIMSCTGLSETIGAAYENSGELAQRLAKNSGRLPGGPADFFNLITFSAAGDTVEVWRSGNDVPAPPRDKSTSASVEALAQDADILVHSTIHPVIGPDQDSGFVRMPDIRGLRSEHGNFATVNRAVERCYMAKEIHKDAAKRELIRLLEGLEYYRL